MASAQHKANEEVVLILSTEMDMELPVFIAGNFNNWDDSDATYRMERVGMNLFRYVFKNKHVLPPKLEYKYHRGAWAYEELDAYGNEAPHRLLDISAEKGFSGKQEDFVPRWKKNGLVYNPAFLPHCHIITAPFDIPQLIKTRRITALLPHDYATSNKRYPVLYLQDGQNLFDDYAPFGNWAVDKKLAIMAEKGIGDLIVVAIDHAHEERVAEFTPSEYTHLGKGSGKKYIQFLAETLKPYIDQNFRTLSDREYTGIGGSSMGGIISIYGGLRYPQVYGRLMVFSPSLWATPYIHFHFLKSVSLTDVKIYLYGGGKESKTMVPNIQNFKKAFVQSGKTDVNIKLSIDPQGLHNEVRWGIEFPKAAEWLFFNK
ncbi:MAG TPA: alpha/beta hydrolase-fold protein [Saprospiraceae bacterium]|nr:alpha/beta hydrolase-fold protein [Saprospiraceae bacterium]HMQ83314.1 alpha/beta hydrolase-fold protein [Saprospiraceae bacterium]